MRVGKRELLAELGITHDFRQCAAKLRPVQREASAINVQVLYVTCHGSTHELSPDQRSNPSMLRSATQQGADYVRRNPASCPTRVAFTIAPADSITRTWIELADKVAERSVEAPRGHAAELSFMP